MIYSEAVVGQQSAVSYFICGTPRTGSTLLCGLLRSTGVAGRPESYFRVPDEAMWAQRWGVRRRLQGDVDYRDYVRAALTEGRTDNGVFAARVMWGTLDVMVDRLGAGYPNRTGADLDLLTEAFGPLRFVHLRRDDTLAQAVSWARAEQTSYWQTGDAAIREPSFDFPLIDDLVTTIEEHNAAWRRWFASFDVQAHQVRYEDVAVDPLGVTQGVLDFLGVRMPAGRPITAPDRRQADEVNEDWIARYRAIVDR